MVAIAPPEPLVGPPPARARRGRGLVVVATAVATLLLLPLVFLVVQAVQVGWDELSRLLFRHLTATLLWNTVSLLTTVAAVCAVIGTATAWCIERTNLPGRRVWAVLIVLPVAIPDFVIAYGWVSVAPSVHGFHGAVLVMSLALYPLVYLPVAASLRGADPAEEEIARGLGLGRIETFVRVTLAECRVAILGGSLIVALAVLSEYGAFEILRYNTFTTAIFTAFHTGFDASVPCALSLVLVLISLVVLAGETSARGRSRTNRSSRSAARAIRRHRLGWATLPVLLGFVALGGLALGVPIGTLVYWMMRGSSSTLPPASIASAAWHTAFYSACAAALATVLALPVALVAVRQRRRSTVLVERSTYIVQALPGLVIALALVYFSVRWAFFLYQSALAARDRVRDPLLPARARRGEGLGGARADRPRRRRTFARSRPDRGVLPRDAPTRRTGPRSGVLPGVPLGGDRAHRDTHPRADGRANSRDTVLVVHDQSLVRRGRALRCVARGDRGSPHLRTRPVVRATAQPRDHVTNLSISGVCKSFGPLSVLRDVDLEVADGMLTAILGPSGSGKTTLLRIIAGFERVDRGVVRIGDVVVDDGEHYVAPEHRRIGYVPQEGALFPHLDVIANVGFGLRRRDRRGPDVQRLIEMVGLTGLEHRYPHQLSGGQQQRVALARALTVEPQLVLLDEPFASLDASLRGSVRADVAQVLEEAGTTAVLVTHDQDEAFSMADCLAIIRGGRITEAAAPQDFYAHPLDPEMAAFVGEANLLTGTIDGTDAITVLGRLPIRGAGADRPPNLIASTAATVLVRPEQVDVCARSGPGAELDGLAGRVVRADYHGHDALLTIRPVEPGAAIDEVIVARVTGNRVFARDADVTIRAHGSVLAWPIATDASPIATQASESPDGQDAIL